MYLFFIPTRGLVYWRGLRKLFACSKKTNDEVFGLVLATLDTVAAPLVLLSNICGRLLLSSKFRPQIVGWLTWNKKQIKLKSLSLKSNHQQWINWQGYFLLFRKSWVFTLVIQCTFVKCPIITYILHACKMELCIKNVPHHAFLQYFTHLAGWS